MTETVLRIAVREFAPFESAIAAQFADFVRHSGVSARIELDVLDLNTLHHKAIAQSGLALGDYDIAFLCTDWLAQAQAMGQLADLAPLLAQRPASDYPQGWSPSLTTMQAFAGGVWGLPYHDGPECLVYRKDLLAAAGLAVPGTWDEYHVAARRLHDPANGVSGTALALFPDGHNGFYDFCIHIWSRGGEPFTPAGRPNFASPQAHEALDFLRTLARDTQAIAPGARETDSVQSGMLFAAGKVAMMANWFGFAAYADTAPDSAVRGLVDVAPLPAGTGGSTVSLNVFWVLAIGSGSTHRDLAWDFLRHCTRPEMDRLTTSHGAIGTRRSTWADPAVNAAIPYYHRLDWLHQSARTLPHTTRLADFSHIIDDVLGQAVTGERTTADLLGEAQRRAEALA